MTFRNVSSDSKLNDANPRRPHPRCRCPLSTDGGIVALIFALFAGFRLRQLKTEVMLYSGFRGRSRKHASLTVLDIRLPSLQKLEPMPRRIE